MRITLIVLLSLFLGSNFGAAQQNADSCGFIVQDGLSHPTTKGPDDIAPLVYIVQQPDSPVEVLSVDLEGMSLSVSGGRHTERDCVKYVVRNRSDRPIQKFNVMLQLSTASGAGGGSGTLGSSLAPGQALEISNSCGVHGNGSAKDNYVRLLVYVDSVSFGECLYKPSLRLPRSLNINPAW